MAERTKSKGYAASLDTKVYDKEVEVGESKLSLTVYSYNNHPITFHSNLFS